MGDAMNALRRPAAFAASIMVSTFVAQVALAESAATSRVSEAGGSELALSRAVDDPVRAFYEARANAPFWLEPDGAAAPAAAALLDWAGQADANALPPARYGVTALAARVENAGRADADERAKIESALTNLFLTYARDLSSGLLEPSLISRDIDIRPLRPDPATLLGSLAAASDTAAFLQTLAPAGPEYPRLSKLYSELRVIAATGDWGPLVAAGGTMRLGDRGPRVAALRARLMAMGDLTPVVSSETEQPRVASNDVVTDAIPVRTDTAAYFDDVLEVAVRKFQARHGLNIDGTVGPATLGAVNTSAAERAAQAAVNMERLRWFRIEPEGRHVIVNIADFSMRLIENGVERFKTRTVVGQSRRHQTPEFNDQLEFIVVNPIWNVPYSIASKEILPLLQENPDYLIENNMQLVGSDLPASQIDWNTVTRRTFPGRLRQMPGADNALGFVKFLFPNNHSVYMHDTPSRKLFARDRRDFSHGCVRLQDPYDFARLLLSLQGYEDPAAKFDQLRARYGEQWLRLDDPIPVIVTYRSTWADFDGDRQFRSDVYGRDQAMADAMTAMGVSIGG
jgi:murein L,D-transpeptidase YcbB/YkuD